MKRLLPVLLLIVMLPVVAATTPSEYTWSTDPRSGGVQDGFCYGETSADEDIDCAGVENWCESRERNKACTSQNDEWLCNDGEWACDSGIRKDPTNASRCSPLQLEAEGCLSVYEGTYTCYSDGEDRWMPNKPGGCSCEEDYECMQGVCQSGQCIAYASPTIDIEDLESASRLVIGDEIRVAPRIGNQLAQQDNLTVRFTGRALEERVISIDVRETDKVSCSTDMQRCNVSVPAKSSVELAVFLEAISYGRGTLIIEARSGTTNLQGSARTFLTVEPRGQDQEESATGVTLPYLVLLLTAGALILAWKRRRETDSQEAKD